jgi:hypothetical protein
VESYFGFDLHFHDGRDGEHFFIFFGHLDFFKKVLFSSVAHFFIGSLILGEFRF